MSVMVHWQPWPLGEMYMITFRLHIKFLKDAEPLINHKGYVM